jgi:hypothetical protein
MHYFCLSQLIKQVLEAVAISIIITIVITTIIIIIVTKHFYEKDRQVYFLLEE